MIFTEEQELKVINEPRISLEDFPTIQPSELDDDSCKIMVIGQNADYIKQALQQKYNVQCAVSSDGLIANDVITVILGDMSLYTTSDVLQVYFAFFDTCCMAKLGIKHVGQFMHLLKNNTDMIFVGRRGQVSCLSI